MFERKPPDGSDKWFFFELITFAMEHGLGKPRPRLEDIDQDLYWKTGTLADSLALAGKVVTSQAIEYWKNGHSVPRFEAPLQRVLTDPEPESAEWYNLFSETIRVDGRNGRRKLRKEAYAAWKSQRDGIVLVNPVTELMGQYQRAERAILADEAEALEAERTTLRQRMNYIPETVRVIEEAARLEDQGDPMTARKLLADQDKELSKHEDEAMQVLEGLARNRLAIGQNLLRCAEATEEPSEARTLLEKALATFGRVVDETPGAFDDIAKSAKRGARTAVRGILDFGSFAESLKALRVAVSRDFADLSAFRNIMASAADWSEAQALAALVEVTGNCGDVFFLVNADVQGFELSRGRDGA